MTDLGFSENDVPDDVMLELQEIVEVKGTSGPVVRLELGVQPWGRWEQDPMVDLCDHVWERARLGTSEIVIRCRRCQAPRCGDSTDTDPCMLRRHHREGSGGCEHVDLSSILGQELYCWTLDPMPEQPEDVEAWLAR